MAVSGVYDLLPIHTRHFYPTELTLNIGEPIITTGMTLRQVDELNERIRLEVAALRVDRAGEGECLAALGSAVTDPTPVD